MNWEDFPRIFYNPFHRGRRFWEFFTVNIRNPNTRRAYFKAVEGFAAWCADKGLGYLSGVTPVHVAAYVEQLGRHAFEAHRQATPRRDPDALRWAGDRAHPAQ